MSFDLSKYVKHDYNKVKDVVELFANPDNITRNNLVKYFSNRQSGQDSNTGKIKILPSLFRITDEFDLPPGVLRCQPDPVPDTTFGIFIFNSLIINNVFKGRRLYINAVLDGSNLGKLFDVLAKMILEGEMTVPEFGEFVDAITWLGYQTELFMPGLSKNLIIPNERVRALKIKLLKENPEFLSNEPIDTNQVAKYVEKIEKPLLKAAKEDVKNDPAARLYDLKKPSFSNNYKNGLVVNGPMMDMKTGKYRINNNSFIEGITRENYDLLANKAMFASYSRGVNTMKGGTNAKYIGPAMQTIILGPPGSDCGSTYYINYTITEDNFDSILYNYALINGKITLLTDKILKSLIGKTIKLRTPQFCKAKQHICNKCAGDLYYKLNVKYLGLASNIPMNASMNKSMKKMHDLTVKTFKANLFDYIFFEK